MSDFATVKEFLVIFGAMTGIVTTLMTLGGTWALMRYGQTQNSKQIDKINESIDRIVKDGDERSKRVQHIEDCGMTRESCEAWMFRGPGALKPIIDGHEQRITKIETVCKIRHGDEALNRG